jgi:hypothetical protein
MCIVYWSEIHQLKYQRGFIFNGFRPIGNSQRWKYAAILTNSFVYWIRICSFVTHFASRRYHSTAKSMIFPNVKNLVHTHSNSDTIARWSSITFFLYTLYSNDCNPWKRSRGQSDESSVQVNCRTNKPTWRNLDKVFPQQSCKSKRMDFSIFV